VLVEWLEYHRLIGVRNFYLYTHPRELMSDGERAITDKLLAPYVNLSFVHLHEQIGWTNTNAKKKNMTTTSESEKRVQSINLNECQRRYAEHNDWLLFTDVDEFVGFPQRYETLSDVLEENTLFESASGVMMPWKTYSAAGGFSEVLYDMRPATMPLVEALRYRFAHSDMAHLINVGGKLCLHTRRRRVDACDFGTTSPATGAPGFAHNCLATAGDASVLPVSSASRKRCGALRHADLQRSVGALNDAHFGDLFLAHFVLRTCFDWSRELVLKRREWIEPRWGRFPNASDSWPLWALERIDPHKCTTLSRQHKLMRRDDSLQHWVPMLRARLSEHPLSNASVRFFSDDEAAQHAVDWLDSRRHRSAVFAAECRRRAQERAKLASERRDSEQPLIAYSPYELALSCVAILLCAAIFRSHRQRMQRKMSKSSYRSGSVV
jgi:Glycosyltransferase family 92